MTDYAVIQIFSILRDIVGPLLGGGAVLFTAYKFWKVWVQHRHKKVEDKKMELLLSKIDALEAKLDQKQLPDMEQRIQNLEDIVVSRE